jgi:hypothetical protein
VQRQAIVGAIARTSLAIEKCGNSGATADVEFIKDRGKLRFDGERAPVKLSGNFAGAQTFAHPHGHLAFALGEARQQRDRSGR